MGIAETIARHATDRAGVQAQAARLLESRGPLIRAEMERRINARTQNDLPTPPSARYTEQAGNAPVRPSETSQGRTARTLPALDTNRVEGPRGQQQQPLQQQRTNVGGVGVENRFLTRGDNADERARMRAAQDEVDSVVGSGREWTREDALRMHNELGGVNIPPANPIPRLEVSDANFRFRQDFLDNINAKTLELDASGKYYDNIQPFAKVFPKDGKLGDIIDDSWEVFRYYPALKELKIAQLPWFTNAAGSYDNVTKTMRLPADIGRRPAALEEVRSTIAHEVQHYIQDVEGWARGGNTEEFKNLFAGNHKDFTERRKKVKEKYSKVVEQVRAIPEVQRFDSLVEANYKDPKNYFNPRRYTLNAIGFGDSQIKDRFLSMTYEEMADSFRKFIKHEKSVELIRPEGWLNSVREDAAQILALKKRLEQYTTVQEQIRLAGKVSKLNAIDKLSYEGYKNLFGEFEARQTEHRLNMTDAERAATPQPINSLDPIDTIVRGQNQELKGNIVPGLSFEQGHIVFHGGPVSAIDRFMLEYIGSGEGAVARGWGFYFAERPGISAEYRNARANEKVLRGGIDKEGWDWRSQVHTSWNGTSDRLFYDTERAITKDLNWDSHYDVYSQFKAAFIGLLGSELESINRRLNGDFSRLSDFQRVDKLFKIIEEANDMTIDKLKRNVKFHRKLSKEAPDNFVQDDLDQNMAALSYAQKFKTFVEDSEDITRELKQVFEDTINRYETSPEVLNLKDDAGLFAIDLKANKEKDYIHLDRNNFGQSDKVMSSLKDIFTTGFIEYARNGEAYVHKLENVYKIIDHYMNTLSGSPSQRADALARFTNELVGEGIRNKTVSSLIKTYKLVKDTNIGRWNDRKFASLVLKDFEIPGSAHYDAMSRDGRSVKDRTNNFVIWDEDIIEQLAVQPYSWRDRGHLEVDPTDHPLTDEYKPK